MTLSIDEKNKKSEYICKFNKLEPASVWGGARRNIFVGFLLVTEEIIKSGFKNQVKRNQN